MPLLITCLLAGLVVFYFQGEPRPGDVTVESAAPATIPAREAVPPTNTPNLVSVPLATPTTAPRELPLLARADVNENEFTPWMSPLALDTYLRQKNRGHQGNFWARGNWIRAIEGRWHQGNREVRIALGVMAVPGHVEWAYRINLTEIAFAEELARKGTEGYTLAQSQAYRHPDGTKRYQAVWQRDNPKRGSPR